MSRYDWKRARRGYWAGRLRQGNQRTLDADVAKAFPDDESVNEALRLLLSAVLKAAARAASRKRRSRAA